MRFLLLTFEPDSKLAADNTESDKRPEIGNCVKLNTGEEGTLLCSKGMGLTPLDLFNDILIERDDLKNFLGPGNWRESDTIALRKRFTDMQ